MICLWSQIWLVKIQLFEFPAQQSVLQLTLLLDDDLFRLMSFIYFHHFPLYLVLFLYQNCSAENKLREEQEASCTTYVKKNKDVIDL